MTSKKTSPVKAFFRLHYYFRGIWCYIRLDFVGLFPLIIHLSNLDGGTPKSRRGDASPRSPYNLSTGSGNLRTYSAEIADAITATLNLLYELAQQTVLINKTEQEIRFLVYQCY